MLIWRVETFLRNICWRLLSYDFPGKWGSSEFGDSVILVPTVKIDRHGQARDFRYRPKSSLKKSCAKAVWKSSGQNPGRRVNDSVCCLEKKTQSLRREATCCIVVLSAIFCFLLDLGSSGEELANLLLFIYCAL